MRCAYPDKHYLLLGNCPGCNPEGYAALFSGPLGHEEGELVQSSASVGVDEDDDLTDLVEQSCSKES